MHKPGKKPEKIQKQIRYYVERKKTVIHPAANRVILGRVLNHTAFGSKPAYRWEAK